MSSEGDNCTTLAATIVRRCSGFGRSRILRSGHVMIRTDSGAWNRRGNSVLSWTLFNVCVWIITASTAPVEADQAEYCQFEIFNASCRSNQVILMEHAQYGRMHIGRCVAKSFGHIGCSANVLDLIDSDCSGKQKCTYSVPALRDLIQPCPKDLTAYLEARYTCINVHRVTRNDCNKNIYLNSTFVRIYIASDVTSQDTKRTSTKCPVIVRALPGQRLNFTLYKFGYEMSGSDLARNLCPIKVSFTEADGSGRDVSQCDLSHREQLVYSSASNKASVFFHHFMAYGGGSEGGDDRILLKVEATGCPDLKTPPNAWVERQGDKAVIRCNYTQETFYVTCTGRTWTGHVTNCTPAITEKAGGTKASARKGRIPLGLVVAVTIGVILGVMFGIAMLITVFVYKRRRKCSGTSKTTSSLLGGAISDDPCHDNDENYARRVWIEHKQDDPYGRICQGHNLPVQYSSSSTDYSHVFELQCSARAHSRTLPSGDYHRAGNPYGCARNAVYARSTDDVDACAMPISSLGGSSGNSPSFATFKADRSAPPRDQANRTPRRQEAARTFGSFGNKNRSLSSVAEVDDVTSPEHQPDVVTSSNMERIANAFADGAE